MRRMAGLFSSVGLVGCIDTSPLGSAPGGSSSSSTAAAETSTTSTTAPPAGPTTGEGTTGAADSGGLPGNVGKGEVRFVALGDAGEGNEGQAAVAQGIATVCAERGCDFALYLGDNIYDVGVDSAMDLQFDQKFEVPYADLDFPFYVALGNHDYGALGNEWDKGDYAIEYSTYSDKWTLPAATYSFQQENVHFVALDTAQLFWDHDTDLQRQFLAEDLAGLQDTWIIAFGHHPYISNGKHGNAGHYEGLGGLIGGATVQEFFESEVCGRAHVYLCGHDHDRQWLLSQCGTEFLVSGAGAKLTELPRRDENPTHWDNNEIEGFLWVEIIDDTFTGVFYDRDGNAQFERTLVL